MSETRENKSPPTEHAIRRAREQGKIAFSSHLAVAVTSIGILGLAVIFGRPLLEAATDDMSRSLRSVSRTVEKFDANSVWNRPLLRPVAFFIGSICLVAVLSRIIQVGIVMQPSRVLPNAANIDFAKGVQRIFAMSNLVRCLQIFLATFAFVLLPILFFSQNLDSLAALGMAKVERLPAIVSVEFGKLFAIASMVALTVGAFDYYFQRTKLMSELQQEEDSSRPPVQAIFNERQNANRRD